MSEYFIVDRIDGENITIESVNEEMLVISKNEVNEIPCEGQVLIRKDNVFIIDIEETEARKTRINKIMKGMWKE